MGVALCARVRANCGAFRVGASQQHPVTDELVVCAAAAPQHQCPCSSPCHSQVAQPGIARLQSACVCASPGPRRAERHSRTMAKRILKVLVVLWHAICSYRDALDLSKKAELVEGGWPKR